MIWHFPHSAWKTLWNSGAYCLVIFIWETFDYFCSTRRGRMPQLTGCQFTIQFTVLPLPCFRFFLLARCDAYMWNADAPCLNFSSFLLPLWRSLSSRPPASTTPQESSWYFACNQSVPLPRSRQALRNLAPPLNSSGLTAWFNYCECICLQYFRNA